MSPAERDAALRAIVSHAGKVAASPLCVGDTLTLAKCMGMLAAIVGDLERRVAILSPCPERRGEPHMWIGDMVPTCQACGTPKGQP